MIEMIKNNIGGIILAVLIIGFLWFQFKPVNGLTTLNGLEFQAAIEKNTGKNLFDVREGNEYKSGTIQAAKNTPLSSMSRQLSAYPSDKDTPIYLFCRSGNRSKKAAQLLLDAGYTNVTHLSGGIGAWPGKIVKP